MALLVFVTIPLEGEKKDITFFAFDEAVCSVTNACPKGNVSIFAKEAYFDNDHQMAKNAGQTAIDALRNALIDNSGLFTILPNTSAFLAATKIDNPKPIDTIVEVPAPASTLIISVAPDYEVGIIANLNSYHTTGLAFTSLEVIREYLLESSP